MKNQHPRQQTFKQQGFTLVEISIVIIILAIITSLVFPITKTGWKKANRSQKNFAGNLYRPKILLCRK